MQAIGQTILQMLLKTAKAVHVSIEHSEKKIFNFSAAFTIDGNGEYLLYSDLCKPRMMKNINEIESIISRSCEELNELTFSIVSNGRYIKFIPKYRLLERLQRLQAMGDAAQIVRDAVQEEMNVVQQTWNEGSRKQIKMLDLQRRSECADSIIGAKNGYLPDGSAIIFSQNEGAGGF